MERLRAGSPVPNAELRRLRVSPAGGNGAPRATRGGRLRPAADQLRARQRAALPLRLGRRRRRLGLARPHRHAPISGRAACERWEEPGSFPGEPVFVAAPRSSNGAGEPAEDDGVLLSVVLDGERENLVPARARRPQPRGAGPRRDPARDSLRLPRPVRPRRRRRLAVLERRDEVEVAVLLERGRARSRSRSGWGSRSRRSVSAGRPGAAPAWSAGRRPRACAGSGPQVAEQVVEGESRVDDVLDDQHVASLDRLVEVLEDPHDPG